MGAAFTRLLLEVALRFCNLEIQVGEEVPAILVARQGHVVVVGEEEAERVLVTADEAESLGGWEAQDGAVASSITEAVEGVDTRDVQSDNGSGRAVHGDRVARLRLDAVSGLALGATVGLVVGGLELHAHSVWEAAADDGQREVVSFNREERTRISLVDGGDGPGVLEATTDNFGASVAGIGYHRVVATNNTSAEVAADVVDNAVVELGHEAASVPQKEVVEAGAVVNSSPSLLEAVEAGVLVNAVPEFAAGVFTNDLLLEEEKHGVVLHGHDRGAVLLLAEGERVGERHGGRGGDVGVEAHRRGEVLEAVAAEADPAFRAGVEEVEGGGGGAFGQRDGLGHGERLGLGLERDGLRLGLGAGLGDGCRAGESFSLRLGEGGGEGV